MRTINVRGEEFEADDAVADYVECLKGEIAYYLRVLAVRSAKLKTIKAFLDEEEEA